MKLCLLFISLFFVAVAGLGSAAQADVNDFTVTSFESDQTLSRADLQGELHIIERINVNFTDNNHGIERAIPSRYKNHSLQLLINRISSNSGAPAQYTTYSSNGNTVLRIGDPDRTITGPQQYTIEYTLRNVITFYDDHDELYWDVNGDQWRQPFTRVSLTLHLPNDSKQTGAPLCYAGSFGTQSHNCTVTSQDNTIESVTTQPLASNQTLTYIAGFQKGYFQSSKWYETLGEYWKQITAVILPIIVIGGGSALYWWRKGRDAKGRGIVVPEYDAPDRMKPLDVGALTDFKVDNRDITATIIDLAVHGYLQIVETKKNKLIGKDKLTYKLKLNNPDFSKLNPDEKALMTALFTKLDSGAETDLSKSKNKLYKVATTLKKSVKDRLKDDGYFRRDPLSAGRVVRNLLWTFGIIIASFVLFAMTGPMLIIGVIIGALIALPFLLKLDARTAKGVAAKEHIQGLKLYLETAEKDRLKMLQGPDAKYAVNAGEPIKTVDLFEKLLPFAMVLGVEKQWSKQFESLYTSPPDWYSGNWSTFNAYYLASSLGDGVGSAVNNAFTSPSSSSGSGFSGGGSSGGGGGGGGGGGW